MKMSRLLNMQPIEFTRTKETVFKEMKLTKDSSAEELLAAMAAEPKLIERPIVIRGDRAVLGRPPETVLDLFQHA